MNDKNDEEKQKEENADRTGFQINLPFGLGWMRGDGAHLTALMPTVRWIVIATTLLYLVLRLVQEVSRSDVIIP